MPTTFYGGGEGTSGRRTAAGLLGAVALVTAILGIVNIANVPTMEGIKVSLAKNTVNGCTDVNCLGGNPGATWSKGGQDTTSIDIKFGLSKVTISGKPSKVEQEFKYKDFRLTNEPGITPLGNPTTYPDTVWIHEECHWKSGDKKARKNLFHTWLGFMRIITSLLLVLAGAIGCYQAYGYWNKETNTDVTSNSANTYILIAMIFIGALAFVHGAHHAKSVDCISNSYTALTGMTAKQNEVIDNDEEDKFKMSGTLYYAAGALSVLTGVLGIYVHRHDEM